MADITGEESLASIDYMGHGFNDSNFLAGLQFLSSLGDSPPLLLVPATEWLQEDCWGPQSKVQWKLRPAG